MGGRVGEREGTVLGDEGSRLRNYIERTPKMPVMSEQSADDVAVLETAAADLLRHIPFFADVSKEDMARFAARARWRNFAAGEVVVDKGDPTDEVFFILAGEVRVVSRTVFGHEAILNDLGMGSFFGELSAIDQYPRSANVTALVQTRLCIVPGHCFIDLVLATPILGRRLLGLLSMRLRSKDERLIEFSVLSVRQRLIAELLRLSRDRGDGTWVLSPPPPQHVLAARIGTRRESVSRELMELSRTGMVTVGRRAIILHAHEQLVAEVQARL